jgi:hypothetical protein
VLGEADDTNVSNSPSCHSKAFATPFTVIVLSNMPGIDPMLQSSEIDVLVDFVSNNIRVGVFLKLQQVQ